jgi:hypothetical protein
MKVFYFWGKERPKNKKINKFYYLRQSAVKPAFHYLSKEKDQ